PRPPSPRGRSRSAPGREARGSSRGGPGEPSSLGIEEAQLQLRAGVVFLAKRLRQRELLVRLLPPAQAHQEQAQLIVGLHGLRIELDRLAEEPLCMLCVSSVLEE